MSKSSDSQDVQSTQSQTSTPLISASPGLPQKGAPASNFPDLFRHLQDALLEGHAGAVKRTVEFKNRVENFDSLEEKAQRQLAGELRNLFDLPEPINVAFKRRPAFRNRPHSPADYKDIEYLLTNTQECVNRFQDKEVLDITTPIIHKATHLIVDAFDVGLFHRSTSLTIELIGRRPQSGQVPQVVVSMECPGMQLSGVQVRRRCPPWETIQEWACKEIVSAFANLPDDAWRNIHEVHAALSVLADVTQRDADQAVMNTGSQKAGGANARRMSWKEVLKQAEHYVGREGFPGLNLLAKHIGCSPSTLTKAIAKSTKLKAAQALRHADSGSIRTTSLNDVLADTIPQTVEPDPAATRLGTSDPVQAIDAREKQLEQLTIEQKADLAADAFRRPARRRSRS